METWSVSWLCPTENIALHVAFFFLGQNDGTEVPNRIPTGSEDLAQVVRCCRMAAITGWSGQLEERLLEMSLYPMDWRISRRLVLALATLWWPSEYSQLALPCMDDRLTSQNGALSWTARLPCKFWARSPSAAGTHSSDPLYCTSNTKKHKIKRTRRNAFLFPFSK